MNDKGGADAAKPPSPGGDLSAGPDKDHEREFGHPELPNNPPASPPDASCAVGPLSAQRTRLKGLLDRVRADYERGEEPSAEDVCRDDLDLIGPVSEAVAGERVAKLMIRWVEAFERGHELSAQELCRDRPELSPLAFEAIRSLRAAWWIDGSTTGAMTVSAYPKRADLGAIAGGRRPGEELAGRYRLVERIGEGGSGEVWRALDVELRREVAVKLAKCRPTATGGDDPFLSEAQRLAKLRHPNIVPVYDVGRTETSYFIVSELLAGNLTDLIRPAGVPAAMACMIVRCLADAAQYAHDSGFVHCDIKPGNVLRDEGGSVLLGDFGIAAGVDEVGSWTGAAGTPNYMAPEQFLPGGRIGVHTDVWGLGVVLYELLTGTLPFRAASLDRLREAVLRHDPPPPSSAQPAVDSRLDACVMRCLSKGPAGRFSSARELQKALAAFGHCPPRRGASVTRPSGRGSRLKQLLADFLALKRPRRGLGREGGDGRNAENDGGLPVMPLTEQEFSRLTPGPLGLFDDAEIDVERSRRAWLPYPSVDDDRHVFMGEVEVFEFPRVLGTPRPFAFFTGNSVELPCTHYKLVETAFGVPRPVVQRDENQFLLLRPGNRLADRYRLAEVSNVGKGVEVWKAMDLELRRAVAVAVARHPRPAGGAEDGLLEEARRLARLRHPGIVQHSYDVGRSGDLFFVVSEYFASNLAEMTCAFTDDIVTTCSVVQKLAAAAQHAHDNGFVHGHLSPTTIFHDLNGNVLLGNFAVSITRASDDRQAADAWREPGLAGRLPSPAPTELALDQATIAAYLAPEQARSGGEVGRHTDVWGLGVVLYELLTARRPFQATGGGLMSQSVYRRRPQPPSAVNPKVPKCLDGLVLRCLAPDPGQRFESPGQLEKGLAGVGGDLPDAGSGAVGNGAVGCLMARLAQLIRTAASGRPVGRMALGGRSIAVHNGLPVIPVERRGLTHWEARPDLLFERQGVGPAKTIRAWLPADAPLLLPNGALAWGEIEVTQSYSPSSQTISWRMDGVRESTYPPYIDLRRWPSLTNDRAVLNDIREGHKHTMMLRRR